MKESSIVPLNESFSNLTNLSGDLPGESAELLSGGELRNTAEFGGNLARSDSSTSESLKKLKCKYRRIWQRAVFRIKFNKAFNNLNEEINKYGTSNDLVDLNNQIKLNIEEILEKKKNKTENFRKTLSEKKEPEIPWYIIHPDKPFKQIWNVLISLVLIYTATVMPFKVAFIESKLFDAWSVIDLVIDFFFTMDICVNLLSAYTDEHNNLVTKCSTISFKYIKSWFFLDLFACIPFDLFEYALGGETDSNSDYSSLLRLMRLPRLYKLIRVVRIAKAFKHYKENDVLEKIQDFLNVNSRIYKLFKFIFSICLCVHIMGCLWFFVARIQTFDPDTWVVRHGYLDASVISQYVVSVYWAFTTITTVGFGDINPGTELEMFLAIIWMMAGVGFYSFTIGSLSSFLSAIDTRESILASKLAAVHEFAKETGISAECKHKIRNCVKFNINKTGSVFSEKHDLFRELPKTLRYEISMVMYSGAAKEIRLFNQSDQALVIAFMPLLKPLKFNDNEFLWRENNYSDEVHFITRGRVNLVLPENEVTYKSFLKGSYIGEIEIILKLTSRISDTQACGNLETLSISRNNFLSVLNDFPEETKEFRSIAIERTKRIHEAKNQLRHILQIDKEEKVSNLAGRENVLKNKYYANPFFSSEESDEKLNILEKEVSLAREEISQVSQKFSSFESCLTELFDRLDTLSQHLSAK